LRPLSDRLVGDLSAFRTLALREALGRNPETAFLALVHALCLSAFHAYAAESCLDILTRSSTLGIQPPDLRESAAAKAFEARHADGLARTVGLDITAAGWEPTEDTYLNRVPKARILRRSVRIAAV